MWKAEILSLLLTPNIKGKRGSLAEQSVSQPSRIGPALLCVTWLPPASLHHTRFTHSLGGSFPTSVLYTAEFSSSLNLHPLGWSMFLSSTPHHLSWCTFACLYFAALWAPKRSLTPPVHACHFTFLSSFLLCPLWTWSSYDCFHKSPFLPWPLQKISRVLFLETEVARSYLVLHSPNACSGKETKAGRSAFYLILPCVWQLKSHPAALLMVCVRNYVEAGASEMPSSKPAT